MILRFFQWLERRRDDRLFTAVANAEHEAWLEQDYGFNPDAHTRLVDLQKQCLRLGKMGLYHRACAAAQRERDARYRD